MNKLQLAQSLVNQDDTQIDKILTKFGFTLVASYHRSIEYTKLEETVTIGLDFISYHITGYGCIFTLDHSYQ